MRRRPLLLVVATALTSLMALTTALPGPSAAAASSAPRGVYVVGDSITALGAPLLRELRPYWFVYGQGGLNVEATGRMVTNVLALNPNPRAIVVALGTNASATWTKERLVEALAPIPPTTKVVLVTTYRDPVLFDALFWLLASREYFQPTYSRWMQELAWERYNTCVAPWRGVVRLYPTLLYDGVHPTYAGRRIWARTIANAVDTCS